MATIELTDPQSIFFHSQAKAPAFVGGFGSGKSHALFARMLATKLLFPKNNLGYFAPSYSLIRDIAHPRIIETLEQTKLRWNLNKSDNILTIKNRGSILFRSMDNPARIVGFEIMQAFVDELDTMPMDQAKDAWEKIIARTRQKPLPPHAVIPSSMRSINQLFVATTPEGYRFVYEMWEKKKPTGYELIKAPTASNPHLPPDYVDTLRATYPENLIEAYLNGEFVNLEGNAVYHMYDRKLNRSDREIREGDILHIGCDFNVNNMSAVVHVVDGNYPIAVHEFSGLRDTPHLIEKINEFRYKGHGVYVYPDATGKKRSAMDASKSDLQLLTDAGLTLRVPYANPPVKDRVITMNSMFCNGNGDRYYLVNDKNCPEYANALERQTYDDRGNPEKNPNNNVDDLNDSAGYFIYDQYHVDRPTFSPVHVSAY